MSLCSLPERKKKEKLKEKKAKEKKDREKKKELADEATQAKTKTWSHYKSKMKPRLDSEPPPPPGMNLQNSKTPNLQN